MIYKYLATYHKYGRGEIEYSGYLESEFEINTLDDMYHAKSEINDCKEILWVSRLN